jgi:hypothetical protein
MRRIKPIKQASVKQRIQLRISYLVFPTVERIKLIRIMGKLPLRSKILPMIRRILLMVARTRVKLMVMSSASNPLLSSVIWQKKWVRWLSRSWRI